MVRPCQGWPHGREEGLMSSRFCLAVGSVLAGLAVALGAFAAHGLDGFLLEKYAGQTRVVLGREIPAAEKYLADFKTAAEYQMTHALAILAIGLWLERRGCRLASAAGWCFVGGIAIFSGGLYALVVSGVRVLGAIVPIGGVLFLVGWGLFAVAVLRREQTENL
jgi:uncharacterized membrane protein YgdD (TMEM256/DUF423 family)